jgi:hypothetical protein
VSDAFLFTANQWVIGFGFFGLVLAASEAGFHLGRSAKKSIDEATKSQISLIQAAILAVLGLLLAFTMSMAVTRFEARKQLVLEESNAIGTAYLRAQLVPSPEGMEIANRLREYLDVRLEYYRTGVDIPAIRAARVRAVRVQDEFWSRAVAFAQKDPRSVTAGLLLQSLNQVIDLESAQWMATVNRVPETVILEVSLVALFSAVLVGYLYGLGNRRHLLSTALLAAAITLVLIVTVDLDRSRRGFIQVGYQPMIDLQDRLRMPAH